MFNRIWNEARNTEHPLETYRLIRGTRPGLSLSSQRPMWV